MKVSTRLLHLSLLSFGIAQPALAATVVADFNEIPMTASATTSLGPNGWSVNLVPCCTYMENGFQFSTDWGLPNKYAMQVGAITSSNPYWWTGSQGLFHSYGGSAEYSNTFIVTRAGGDVFDLLSLDVAAFSNSSRYFMVYGQQAGGAWVQKYFPLLDDSYNTLETLTFGDDFKDLTMVTFSAWGQQIDNVTFGITAAVPEPETYALMLAGLGLVGFVARRRSASAL
jgi:hypothetical protein